MPSIKVWDVAEGRCRRSITVLWSAHMPGAILPDGRVLMGCSTPDIRIYDCHNKYDTLFDRGVITNVAHGWHQRRCEPAEHERMPTCRPPTTERSKCGISLARFFLPSDD